MKYIDTSTLLVIDSFEWDISGEFHKVQNMLAVLRKTQKTEDSEVENLTRSHLKYVLWSTLQGYFIFYFFFFFINFSHFKLGFEMK